MSKLRTACKRQKHGKALSGRDDRSSLYCFATAQKSTRSPSDLSCSCIFTMFTSVLVRYAGITLTTPVGPETCLPDFQQSLAKQTGWPKTSFVSPWSVSVTALLLNRCRRACGSAAVDVLRKTTPDRTCVASNPSWMHRQPAGPLERWQFHCENHIAAQTAKRQVVPVLEGKHGYQDRSAREHCFDC